ncbi:uncharacterized protein G2W53_034597 [Senna tora]|uniref:Uncharacterized protein n=1 Tax=Senna tora TaxID=362788 RepID=A0A834WC26_9FABA|nr:uncharacterized protein G2W53_034597 [Senna tora]
MVGKVFGWKRAHVIFHCELISASGRYLRPMLLAWFCASDKLS